MPGPNAPDVLVHGLRPVRQLLGCGLTMQNRATQMAIPGFAAEASLIRPAQLPTCSPGAMCVRADGSYVCNCPAGTTCTRNCPINCYRTCFLWWCWTRCERSQVCSADLFCL